MLVITLVQAVGVTLSEWSLDTHFVNSNAFCYPVTKFDDWVTKCGPAVQRILLPILGITTNQLRG